MTTIKGFGDSRHIPLCIVRINCGSYLVVFMIVFKLELRLLMILYCLGVVVVMTTVVIGNWWLA